MSCPHTERLSKHTNIKDLESLVDYKISQQIKGIHDQQITLAVAQAKQEWDRKQLEEREEQERRAERERGTREESGTRERGKGREEIDGERGEISEGSSMFSLL